MILLQPHLMTQVKKTQRHTLFSMSMPGNNASILNTGLETRQRKVLEFIEGLRKIKEESDGVIQTIRIDDLAKSLMQYFSRRQDAGNELLTPFMIGIAGASASGKTTITKSLVKLLNETRPKTTLWHYPSDDAAAIPPIASSVSLDNFYHDLSLAMQSMGNELFLSRVNFDAPDILNLKGAALALEHIQKGQVALIDYFDRAECKSYKNARTVHPTVYVITEGLYTLRNDKLKTEFDLKLYIETSPDILRSRWFPRFESRGGLIGRKAEEFFQRVLQMYQQHVEPTRQNSTIIINNTVPIKTLEETLRKIALLMHKALVEEPRQTNDRWTAGRLDQEKLLLGSSA